MAVLSAYLDASGSENDPACHFLAVGGYVATDEQWSSFEKDWHNALSEAGVEHFHMKEFAHSIGEFRAWRGDERRRGRFLEQLAHIIKVHNLEDFGLIINMDQYRKVNRIFRLREIFGAYVIAAGTVMSKIGKWHERYGKTDSLLILLERGDDEQIALRKLVSNVNVWGGPEPIFMRKKTVQNGKVTYCLPFQASDFLAYELAKSATDFFVKGKHTGRESLYRLRYGSGVITLNPPMWMYIDTKFLMALCALYKIRKRE